MKQEEATQIDAIKFVQLLKERFPFLRRDTLQRAQDAICALIEQRSTNQQQWSQALPGNSSLEAKKKRLGRCIQDPQMDSDFFLFCNYSAREVWHQDVAAKHTDETLPHIHALLAKSRVET